MADEARIVLDDDLSEEVARVLLGGTEWWFDWKRGTLGAYRAWHQWLRDQAADGTIKGEDMDAYLTQVYDRAETLFCMKGSDHDRAWLEEQAPDVVSRATSLFFRSWFGGKTPMLKQLTNQMLEATQAAAGTLKPPSISPTGSIPLKPNRAQRRRSA